MPEKEITLEIKRPEVIILFLILAGIFVMQLLVTLNSPIAFGDEGFHTRFAQYIAEEKEYPKWVPFWGTNLEKFGFSRQALWNFLEASFLYIFGFSEFIIKFLTPFIVFLTGIAVYLLVKKLFNSTIAFITAILTVTIPSLVTYSVLLYTDILFTFYTALFFFSFLVWVKEDNKKFLILAAIFASFSFLTKIVGLFIFGFIGLAFLYQLLSERKVLQITKRYIFIGLTIAIILSGFFIRNFYYFNTPICYSLPFLNVFNVKNCSIDEFEEKYQFAGRVEQTGTEQSVYQMGILNYLNFAYGKTWLVIFGFLAGLILIILRREKIDNYVLLYLMLFLLSLYISTTRAEDTARYTLGWVPIIALVSARFFDEIYRWLEKYQKYLGLLIIIPIIIFSYINLKEKLDTMILVKQFSPSFFEACDWVKENLPKDSRLMTIWSHRAAYNCQRNVVSNMADIALSKDLNYTLDVAKRHGITHLFIQKFSIDHQNRNLAERYNADWVQWLENNPEHFKKVYENGPPLQECLQRGNCDGNIIYEIVIV